jgi:tRNA A-37 threonylcarbamoyl transferase component Bud32
MTRASDNSAKDRELEAILHTYLQAVDAGQAPDRDALLQKHPQFASELAAFFANQDEVAQMAQGMAEPAVPAPRTTEAARLDPREASVQAPGTQPRAFGDYELLEEIGRGGMGVVYKARQVSLNRMVALKVIRQPELASADEVHRFLAEAEAAADLEHPHIVPIYEVGEHQGQPYFSMRLIDGGSLAQVLATRQWAAGSREAQRRAGELVAAVARAVHAAHQRRILHRDLKPGNILLDTQGRLYITDFGLAKRVTGPEGPPGVVGLTRTGEVVGTPPYMAPEQALAVKVLTTAVDVYGLGAVLYELLTGRPPFRGDSPLETLQQVVGREPERPRALDARIDRDLETICLKCLAKEPRGRYGSAEALAEDLERWLAGEPIRARPVGALERAVKWVKRRPASAAVLAGVILLPVAGSLMLVVGQRLAAQAAKDELNRYRAEVDAERQRAAEVEAARERLPEQLAKVALLWERYPDLALTLLEDERLCPRHLRDGSWEYYHHLCKLDRRPWVQLVAATNGNVLLALGVDRTIRLLDATGKPFRTLAAEVPYDPAKNGRVLALSPDGSQAYWVKGGELWGCDVNSGAVHGPSDHVIPYITGLPAFSADGKRMAILSATTPDNRIVWVIDLLSNKGQAHLPGVDKPLGIGKPEHAGVPADAEELLPLAGSIVGLMGSPSGQGQLLAGSAPICLTYGRFGLPISALAFAPDGQTLALAMKGGDIQLWDVDFDRRRAEMRGHPGTDFGLTFTPDGKTLAERCDQPPPAGGEQKPPVVLILAVPQPGPKAIDPARPGR